MLHKFLLHPPLQELHRWVSLLQPHQLRTWAKLPLGSPTSLIANMVRKMCIKKCAARFPSHLFLNHPPTLPISLDILTLSSYTPFVHSFTNRWSLSVPFILNSYTYKHASCMHEPHWLCHEDWDDGLWYPGLISSHFYQDSVDLFKTINKFWIRSSCLAMCLFLFVVHFYFYLKKVTWCARHSTFS